MSRYLAPQNNKKSAFGGVKTHNFLRLQNLFSPIYGQQIVQCVKSSAITIALCGLQSWPFSAIQFYICEIFFTFFTKMCIAYYSVREKQTTSVE